MAESTRVIGLLGGMSWESTALYYRLINTIAIERLGGHRNARSVLCTLDYETLLGWGEAGNWDAIGEMLADAARTVQEAGAAFVLLTANSAHNVADQVRDALDVPLLHIADPTGEAIGRAGLSRVGIIGTRFATESTYISDCLRDRHDVEVLFPEPDDRATLHSIIVDELTVGRREDKSRDKVLEIVGRLVDAGAEGIVIGCTELPLLLSPTAYPVPAFDTTELHARAAVDLAIDHSSA